MKKIFSVVSFIFLSASLFATDLYVQKESYSYYEGWDNLLDLLKEEGKKQNINIIDFRELSFEDDFGWGPTDEEKIENLENEIKRLEDLNKTYSWLIFEGDSFEDQIAQKQKEIEKLKEKIAGRTDPKSCFPLLSINIDGDYDEYYNLSASLQLASDSAPYNAQGWDMIPSRLKMSEEDFLLAYIKAFFPLLETPKQNAKPQVIDSRSLKIEDTSGRSSIFAIAPKDDYSFVIRRGAVIENYSPTWELKSTLTSKLPKTEGTFKWKPYSWDGKTVDFGILDNPNTYTLNSSKIQKNARYKYPSNLDNSTVDYRFSSSGNPVIVSKDNHSGDITLYYPQKDESIKSVLLFSRWWENIFLGPKDTIWIGDNKGSVYIFSSQGKLNKIIQTPLQNGSLAAVLDDGTFITGSEKGISRHNDKGHIIWSVPLEGALANVNYLSGARNGMYYLFNYTSRIVVRMAEADAKIPPVLAVIRDNSEKLSNGTLNEMAKANLAIGDVYYAEKNYSSALSYYNKYLELSPADAKTSEKKLNCEVYINKKEAKTRTKKAIDYLDEYGEETAKSEYQKAMKLLEKLKKQVPWDTEVQDMYAELKNAFSTSGEQVTAEKLSLKVSDVDVNSLFPALISIYAKNPSGFVEVENTSKNTVKNISVQTFIRKYMDFPSASDPASEIKPGEKTMLPLNTVLNESVLAINEATPVQMQLTLNWEENGKTYSTQVTRPVTIYKSSALTWADTAMASCFVQPNDPMVSDFISKALAIKTNTVLSKNLTKALQISNALGTLPLTYMSDPTTPATQVIDNEFAIDTVRLPSETLSLKGGDCDDMTTLFCSLMEGTGINSAFITVPGHIFAAFDTGVAYNNIWQNMDKNHLIFEENGNVWIPVECTSLAEGFEKAWVTASKEIGKQSFEITTIAGAWETYSSVPSNTTSATKENAKLNVDSTKKMNKTSKSSVLKTITKAIESTDIEALNESEMNLIAKFYHTNGDDEKAIEVLTYAVTLNPEFQSGLKNLAMLYEAQGDKEQANTFNQRASSISIATSLGEKTTGRANDADDAWAE